MELSSQLVPAVIILVANLLSGKHSSLRWEYVTAIFGWCSVLSLLAYLFVIFLVPESVIEQYLIQISLFCLITALARDYERILRPLFPWNR